MPAQTDALSAHLRTSTRTAHDTAETTGFITRLMGGELGVDAYADLAAQQLPVYEALERASARLSGDARVRTLIFDELTRTPSIRQDLEFLFGPEWNGSIDILDEARAYAQRIDEINDVPEYAAHAYTRYLGDLSGGQIIKRMMQRHYGMGDEGLAFYHFEEIPKPKPFKDIYRERLDGLGLTGEELDRAGREAQLAFELNTKLFTALGARH
ncbi:biliverdin-producing heme oxygenase [Rarobacter faecitabidus]|uniref:Heme oxygenase n=1 Tax=Rarobacter faecitabidus TaxID=13243 RepID=A0A542ZPD4_RARFA|nr:biliverdin-producing heme oxygenase [Rarobacter faecitabidus]TQL62099.1 heme oxygenase [Rarobacter faecitabidus]